MDDNKLQSRSVLAPLVFFAVATAMALIMMIATLVMWLTELIGSATWATLIVGGFFTFVAWLIYVLSVKQSILYVKDRLDTIYDVAFAVRNGYKVALRYLGSFVDEILRK